MVTLLRGGLRRVPDRPRLARHQHSKTAEKFKSFMALGCIVAIATATAASRFSGVGLFSPLPQKRLELGLARLDPLPREMMLEGAQHHALEALFTESAEDELISVLTGQCLLETSSQLCQFRFG